MAYIPQLRYIFVHTRAYQMDYHLSLLRYLNDFGITPRILATVEEVVETLRENNITFERLNVLPQDYDVMLSLEGPFGPFGRYCLEESMKAGKINIYVAQLPVPYRYKHEGLFAAGWKFFHAACAADQRTIESVKSYNNETLWLNTGHPTWDQLSTEQFRKQVADIKERFGEKLLIVSVDSEDNEEFQYSRMAVNCAESMGFKVILQVHPGHLFKVSEKFADYINPGFNRFALFSAASHVIASIISAVVPENLYLGTNIGCKPYGIKAGRPWGELSWYDDPNQLYQDILPFYGKEYLDMIAIINDEDSMARFLSSEEKCYTQEDIHRILGRPQVGNFTENVFRTIETHFSDPENVAAAHAKSKKWQGIVEYFGWECERSGSPVRHIKNPVELLKCGIDFLRAGKIGTAVEFLRMAEKFSGMTDNFDFIQYAMATCHYLANNIEEAGKYLYKALLIKPDCQEYQNLKAKIDMKAQAEQRAPVRM